MNYEKAKKELKKYSSKERKKKNEYFFKTGKGEYGEGDIFIGVRVPDLRKIAKQFSQLSFQELQKLISSKIHEERLLAILILVQNSKFVSKNKNLKAQKSILKFYLNNREFINNWDLVDLSAHYILGQAILDEIQDVAILYKFTKSKKLWERRISIISTWIFIRENRLKETLEIAKILLNDKEDLIHKAVGWMLREVWKKDSRIVEVFLMENYENLSRTTLRYAIEKIEEKKRKMFLKGDFTLL